MEAHSAAAVKPSGISDERADEIERYPGLCLSLEQTGFKGGRHP